MVPEHKRKAKRTHEELLKELPVEEVVHESEEVCDKCGSETKQVGKEFVRDELVYIPASLFVRKHYSAVYKCTQCGKSETETDIESQHFVKAICPQPMIPHSFCSPELLAHIAYEKYALGTPLHRQAGDLSAKGVCISTATLANWIIYASKAWLKPLYDEMKEDLLCHEVIHADETVVQVLREQGKKPKSESRMWVYCAGEIGCKDNILFEYQPTRNGDHAKSFLGDFAGHLVTDGFSGYDKLTGMTHHGCWAHLRRKFVEALPTDKELAKDSSSARAIEYIDRLFKIERECETDADRQKKRNSESRKIIEEFYEWLGGINPVGTGLPAAVGYAMTQKKKLTAYLDSPNVPMSNNRAENAIRPFCIGRKNWLFSTSVKGAEASAVFYSLAATAKANDLPIEEYFTMLFKTLPNAKGNKEVLTSLLPFNVDKK